MQNYETQPEIEGKTSLTTLNNTRLYIYQCFVLIPDKKVISVTTVKLTKFRKYDESYDNFIVIVA